MAGKTAVLSIRIIADGKQAGAEFSKTNAEVAKFDDGLRKASIGAGIAVAGIGAVAIAAGRAASDLQQATGAVESVFGAYARRVKAFADEAADNVGLAKSEYSQLSSVIGAQLKNMGVPMSAVADQTNDLVTLGADLAATFGGSTSDAVAALSSLLRGERDPIERYGVSIKQADINARLAALGQDKLTGAALRSAETQATLDLLTRQTADAHGQFAREADTAAGAQQRANAKWEDAQAQLGEVLLPIMADAANLLSELAEWVTENSEEVTILAVVIGSLAAGILLLNGAVSAYRTIAALAAAAQVVWNIAMSANPIGILVVGIGGLIALIVALVADWEEVGRVAGEVWDNIIGWIQDAIKWVQEALGWIGQLFSGGQSADITVSGGGGVGGFDVPPVPPAWSNFDDVLVSAYLADAADGSMDGTGGWFDDFSAKFTEPFRMLGGGDTYEITINGAIDVDSVARQLEEVLEKHARKTGRVLTGTGGDRRWR